MDIGSTEQIFSDLQRVNFACFDKPTIIGFLSRLQQWRGRFDAVEVDAACRLQELSVTDRPTSLQQRNDTRALAMPCSSAQRRALRSSMRPAPCQDAR